MYIEIVKDLASEYESLWRYMLRQVAEAAGKFGFDVKKDLSLSTALKADLGLSSREVLAFIATLEQVTQISIPTEQTRQIDTLGDAVACVHAAINEGQ